MDGLKRYVNDDHFRVDGDKNMRLLEFAFSIVFVWTGPETVLDSFVLMLMPSYGEEPTSKALVSGRSSQSCRWLQEIFQAIFFKPLLS